MNRPALLVKVKICGITNLEDALAAAELGADALGFIFAPSPRHITPSQAAAIVASLPPFISRVGVFVDEALERVKEILTDCSLHYAQLHGSESPEFCQALGSKAIKAFRVRDESVLRTLPDYPGAAFLLDSYSPDLAGGTGQTFNWDIAARVARQHRIILSGGLNPENVAEAIARVRPCAVDVSSGVEAYPGKKDCGKLRQFIRAAKGSSHDPDEKGL